MVGGILKAKVDENEVDKLNKVKRYGVLAVEPTRRAALGDLQNRVTGREVSQKEVVKDTNLQNILRNAKARVDTRIKKPAVAINSKSTTTAPFAQSKIVTRSNSVRLGVSSSTTNTNRTNSGSLQRHGSVLLANQKSKTTVTTKIVENKAQQVKYVNNAKVPEKTIKIEPTLRREDSNLSRKSLTKIKAALSREGNKTNNSSKGSTKLTSNGSNIAAAKKVSGGEETTTVTVTTEVEPLIVMKRAESQEKYRLSPQSCNVEDIDAGDGENLMLVSEYAKDIYDYLYSLEDIHYIRANHLDKQVEVQVKMRAVLIDWINEVHLQFHLASETYQLAVAIIDRYLQKVKDTKRSHLQLVGVTALFLAAKYEELYPPSITDFVYITDDTYTVKQILHMELKIFKALDCNLSRPLPLHFLRRFSKAAKAEDSHHTMSKYFLELASVEYDMAHYKPSEVASASLFLALQLLKGDATAPIGFNDELWSSTLKFYTRYSADYLHPITRKLAKIVRNAPTAKLKAVYKKYQSSTFHKIATRDELYGSLIDSIINSVD